MNLKSIFVQADCLARQLEDQNIVIVDCRFNLMDERAGEQLFLQSHIPGAHYIHLGKELSGPVKVHGGRHPLPTISVLEDVFRKKGINQKTKVIVYDNGVEPFAARCFWILRFLGHHETYILQGGFHNWMQQKYPTEAKKRPAKSGDFIANPQPSMIANVDDVRKSIASGNSTLLDSREYMRFLGEQEPLDRIAGRVPTAIHSLWLDVFESGFYKSKEELVKHFDDIPLERPVVVYCGSGVTAAANVVALYHAGYKHVRLYSGSFSDWISYRENEIEKG